jgi:hypothetical protein
MREMVESSGSSTSFFRWLFASPHPPHHRITAFLLQEEGFAKKLFVLQSEVTGEGGVEIEVEVTVNVKVKSRSKVRTRSDRGRLG